MKRLRISAPAALNVLWPERYSRSAPLAWDKAQKFVGGTA